MTYALIALAVLLWCWFGIKTWAFTVNDVSDHTGKPGVILGFFAGLIWPLTYSVLALILLVGVMLGDSLENSIMELKSAWSGDD